MSHAPLPGWARAARYRADPDRTRTAPQRQRQDAPMGGRPSLPTRSRKCYDAVFAAMGGSPGTEDAKGRLIYAHNGWRFMVTKPIDGKPATRANGGTIGFTMSDSKQVDAWHKAGVANGGTTAEDPPGVRQGAAGPIYLAYLRDPDGNKLCAVHRMPDRKSV